MAQTYVFAPDIGGSSGNLNLNTFQSYGEVNCAYPGSNPFLVKNTSMTYATGSASGLYQRYNTQWKERSFYTA